jgi:hypothetical protein
MLALWGTDEPAEAPATSTVAAGPTVSASSEPVASASSSEQSELAEVEIAVSVTVSPKGARIFIDGEEVEGNPYEAQVPRDDREHEVRAEADGHETITRSVAFDRDVALELELVEKPRRVAAGRPVRRPPSPQPTAEPTTPPSDEPSDDDWMKKRWPKAKRPIDDDNPYAK